MDTLEGISFDGIEPGEYGRVRHPTYATHSLLPQRKALVSRALPERSLPERSLRSYSVGERRGFAPQSFGMEESIGAFGAHAGSGALKPEMVESLEHVLTASYGLPAEITSVKEVAVTRKHVKEVYFVLGDIPSLLKVWVFKADPERTAKELAAYHVASEHQVPTARPIGYTPSGAGKYPYEIAVLGGIVEDAGEPYKELIGRLSLKPDIVFRTAQTIAGVIAQYQAQLTAAQRELEELGIPLAPASPSDEIASRFAAGSGLTDAETRALARSCDELSTRQVGTPLVSHRDLHTGNLVTVVSSEFHQIVPSLKRFGVIDWESIGFDNPYSDLQDFWLHHQREALRSCGEYDHTFDELRETYDDRLSHAAAELGMEWHAPTDRDARIQGALWHIYEMFDPVRKDEQDIMAKARFHVHGALDALSAAGVPGEAGRVGDELKRALRLSPRFERLLG